MWTGDNCKTGVAILSPYPPLCCPQKIPSSGVPSHQTLSLAFKRCLWSEQRVGVHCDWRTIMLPTPHHKDGRPSPMLTRVPPLPPATPAVYGTLPASLRTHYLCPSLPGPFTPVKRCSSVNETRWEPLTCHRWATQYLLLGLPPGGTLPTVFPQGGSLRPVPHQRLHPERRPAQNIHTHRHTYTR